MKKEYDFTNAKRNPYAKKLKKPINIRLDEDVLEYFKKIAEELSMPYQGLINLYLRQVQAEQLRPKFLKTIKDSSRIRKAA